MLFGDLLNNRQAQATAADLLVFQAIKTLQPPLFFFLRNPRSVVTDCQPKPPLSRLQADSNGT